MKLCRKKDIKCKAASPLIIMSFMYLMVKEDNKNKDEKSN